MREITLGTPENQTFFQKLSSNLLWKELAMGSYKIWSPGSKILKQGYSQLFTLYLVEINFIYKLINTFTYSSNDNSLNTYYVLNAGKIKASLKKKIT